MSKSRLRALNTQNYSINAPHNDINSTSLKLSWKYWYTLLQGMVSFKNQCITLSKNKKLYIRSKKKRLLRTLKRYLFIKKIYKRRKNTTTSHRRDFINVKIITQQNQTMIIFLRCPYWALSSMYKRKKRILRRYFKDVIKKDKKFFNKKNNKIKTIKKFFKKKYIKK